MGKAAMCIMMLQILNTGRVYKVSELAEIMDTLPRNIIEYKKELDELASECGYQFYIQTVYGRYGGYKLDGDATIPSIKLTLQEKNALIESYKFLVSNESVVNKEELIKAYSKIMSTLMIEDKNLELMAVNKVDVYKKNRDIKAWHEALQQAMKQKRAILLDYEFLKEPRHVVKVHPYEFFIYDNEWRFFGWSCEHNDVFYFKLSRIKNIEITHENFRVWKYFRAENYIKDGVFTQNGKMMRVELIASGIRAKLFKEKDFGANQVCEDLPDGTTKVSLDLQENPSTYNFILGCGDLVEVISPKELRDKIKDLSKNIYDKYK